MFPSSLDASDTCDTTSNVLLIQLGRERSCRCRIVSRQAQPSTLCRRRGRSSRQAQGVYHDKRVSSWREG
ncbi:hypothetical protein COCCADRAFT_105615 [Bipolaris zeicola 26-R-13]|uniref:Uncharacterized protein n=1 Tax=Cochliobolus carbonum (strain 26-R-13) TaxID=930089 RepID=W6YEY6_COCC2|nr:uncharacterized protein COCCADRAFT_105615 [Bipolaris zeicola 26-R-13]EUC29786.1 hypothetical protein COCCADRAFT_105615 [Bipolaris zeicola 26-R-13]